MDLYSYLAHSQDKWQDYLFINQYFCKDQRITSSTLTKNQTGIPFVFFFCGGRLGFEYCISGYEVC